MRGPRIAMKSGPRLRQLEKALTQKRRPNTAKKKKKNKVDIKKSGFFKKKKKSQYIKLHLEKPSRTGEQRYAYLLTNTCRK